MFQKDLGFVCNFIFFYTFLFSTITKIESCLGLKLLFTKLPKYKFMKIFFKTSFKILFFYYRFYLVCFS